MSSTTVQSAPMLKDKVNEAIHIISNDHEVTPEVISSFFGALKACIEEYKITPENMYNMDETGTVSYNTKVTVGFAIGTAQTSYVVVDAHQRKKYQAQPGRQEWITAIECICVDGTAIEPCIIFKGKNLLNGWIPLDTIGK